MRVCQIDECVEAAKKARGCSALSVHSVALPVDVINATRVLAVFVERPKAGSIVKRSRCGHLGGDAGVVGVGVFNVENAIAVIVRVKVIRHAVRVKIAGPRELVDAPIVVIVFVVSAWTCPVVVFIGHAVVVVVHGVLISEVELTNRVTGPRMDGRGVKVAVG